VEGNNKNFTHVGCFHRRFLHTILGISWQDHITNDELMRRAGMEDLLSNIDRARRMTLAGLTLRLPSDRPASVTMQWIPSEGKR